MQLYIGNKNYSSWSMRPWVVLKQAGIEFDELVIRMDYAHSDSLFRRTMDAINAVGKVPVLVDEGLHVWDSLAICEYLAERYPEKQLWPHSRQLRAQARSVCADMHSGFVHLRTFCGMNIEADLAQFGAIIMRDQDLVRKDLARLDRLWTDLLAQHGAYAQGMLFGAFSIVDAYFAPVCMRIHSYHLPVSPASRAYVDRIRAVPAVAQWIRQACAEHDFIDSQERYRTRAMAEAARVA